MGNLTGNANKTHKLRVMFLKHDIGAPSSFILQCLCHYSPLHL